MDINKFGPNLSFFFSNGIDPEYSVIGRVARRIWAKAMAKKYGASAGLKNSNITSKHREESCMLRRLISMILELLYKLYMRLTIIVTHCIPMLMTRLLQLLLKSRKKSNGNTINH